VFDTAVPYLISVETPDESSMSGFYGKKEFSKNEFASILTSNGYTIDQSTNHLSWISYISYTVGGRVKTAYICVYEISGIKLMKMLSLQSANITVSTGDNGFVFTTEGIGHGVGLSEYGAWVMAESGKTYKEIIIHYYKGVYISFN
jgi:stage II sporulation protein D